VLTSHEAAMNLTSPQGLMLHGEVGTGKSMLIDLFADCLPNRKKRRCHFNTFMLDTISRLEQLRKAKLVGGSPGMQDEYSLLWLAKDLIQKSPILFLDEFQLPDRVASKILSNLMTSFFQLGGVLIATSNRMPEELAKAAGMDFERPVSRVSRLGWTLGLGGGTGKNDGPGQLGEFAKFLEVLRARCEVWEMEGKEDYRRLSGEEDGPNIISTSVVAAGSILKTSGIATSTFLSSDTTSQSSTTAKDSDATTPAASPKHYLISPSSEAFATAMSNATFALNPIPWTSTTLTVYGRPFPIPAQHNGTALFTWSQICGAVLGPADYITLASTYHTIAITDIPILTFHQKNEARRFITLLDALYEARCKLLLSAAAAPDDIFFPEPKPGSPLFDSKEGKGDAFGLDFGTVEQDATYSETYSEIYQDATSPFRPNISSYSSSASLPHDALEDDPPNRLRRPNSSFTDERSSSGVNTKALDFANIRGLTGEDEVFAVKRAQSRVWEMCSSKWWAKAEEEGWWRPLSLGERHWERGIGVESSYPTLERETAVGAESDVKMKEDSEVDPEVHIQRKGEYPRADGKYEKDLFPHEGASPFRTVSDAPPKIDWTHVWGTMKWGKGAGAWGKGVEGLEERRSFGSDEEEKAFAKAKAKEERRGR
jgi:protein AFG1